MGRKQSMASSSRVRHENAGVFSENRAEKIEESMMSHPYALNLMKRV
jgi:hypothetical protein